MPRPSDGQGLLWLLDFLGSVMQGQEGIIKQLQQEAREELSAEPPPDPEKKAPPNSAP